jgi:hypothetical protein
LSNDWRLSGANAQWQAPAETRPAFDADHRPFSSVRASPTDFMMAQVAVMCPSRSTTFASSSMKGRPTADVAVPTTLRDD